MKVELLKRTPFGWPGEIVEVEKEVFEAYSSDVMKEAKAVSNKAILSPKTTK